MERGMLITICGVYKDDKLVGIHSRVGCQRFFHTTAEGLAADLVNYLNAPGTIQIAHQYDPLESDRKEALVQQERLERVEPERDPNLRYPEPPQYPRGTGRAM